MTLAWSRIRRQLKHERSRMMVEPAADSVLGAAAWGNDRYRKVEWQARLAEVCDGFVEGVLDRAGHNVLAGAPPRHGKTEIIGRAMPRRAYMAAAKRGEPMSVLYATATADRAREVSSRARESVETLHRLTGDDQWAPGRIWTTTEWETEGGHSWFGVGAGGATGGIGARILIMDDLIGSSRTYRSITKRMAIHRYVEEDLLSRVMDGGSSFHLETRRGLGDTTDYILDEYGDSGEWRSHVFPCFDETREGSPYLWPEMYGKAWRKRNPHLHDQSALWLSLYQQQPVPEGGMLIPAEHLTTAYPRSPEVQRELCERVVIGVDLATTGKTSSDHCAMVVIGIKGAMRYVLDVVRQRMPYTQARVTLQELAKRWRADAVVVERAANGDALIDDLREVVPGIRGETPNGRDKVARLTPWLPMIAAGQLLLPERPEVWSRAFRLELTHFTGVDGCDDDQVDALVWALVAAASTGGSSLFLDAFG